MYLSLTLSIALSLTLTLSLSLSLTLSLSLSLSLTLSHSLSLSLSLRLSLSLTLSLSLYLSLSLPLSLSLSLSITLSLVSTWINHRHSFFVCQLLGSTLSDVIVHCKNDLYLPPRAKLNVYRNTLRYAGALIWNDLPANVKQSVQMFKSNYLKMYFS